jgi:uncharacterized protein YneF (UPF0154 family)
MDTVTIIIIVVILLVLGGVLGFVFFRQQRTKKLREQFGPEYDRAVRKIGGQDKAEAELEKRQKRIEQLEIHSLSSEEREQFSRRWKAAQARFVDDPAEAIGEADQLVMEVMETRGYPMGDFEQRAADISVDHPHVVRDYRAARKIALANERGEANTEDLRQAMVHYRSLFEELLDPAHNRHKEIT